jgi:hypothetical protein
MPISGKMVNRGVGVGGVFRINVSPAIPASHVVADEVSSSFLAKNGAKLSSAAFDGRWRAMPLTAPGEVRYSSNLHRNNDAAVHMDRQYFDKRFSWDRTGAEMHV